MTEENFEQEEHLEAEAEEQEEGQQQENDNPFGDSEDDIAEAKKFGYKPPEEYDGNPKYQVSAKEFLARKEKGGVIKKLQSDLEETQTAYKKMQKFMELQVQTAKERAIEELRAKQAKAIDEDGISPAEAFDAYEKGKIEVEQKYSVKEDEPKKVGDAPEINKFYQENPWYHEDVVMQGAANALHRSIASQYPTMPLSQQLDMVKKQIVERFSDKFENQKKKTQSIEGGDAPHGGAIKRKDTLQSLGLSAKDIADVQSLIKQGVLKDEADFIKSYKTMNGVK